MRLDIKKIFVLLVMFFCLIPKGYVRAEEPIQVLQIEKPTNLSVQSGTVDITGFALSKNTVSKVDVYVDNSYLASAVYGIARQDVADKYTTYPNSLNSGFNYKLKTTSLSDGIHQVKLVLVDSNQNTFDNTVQIDVKNTRTPIMGQAVTTKGQMINYFQQYNTVKDFNYAYNFVSITLEEAAIEGVRGDAAFVQMMKETNFLRFTGEVKENQNNFAGIKTETGVGYQSFSDIRQGIRAVIQHLKAYASKDALNQAIVDPRFRFVTRETAPYIEWLGINENPYSRGWAEDYNYGYDIVKKLNYVIGLSANDIVTNILSFNLSDRINLGNTTTISTMATAPNKPLYRYWIGDMTTGEWRIVKDYSENGSFNWTPSKTGKYIFEVHVKDINSTKGYDQAASKVIYVDEAKASINNFTAEANMYLTKTYTIQTSATSSNKPLYRYWLGDMSTGEWRIIRDYNENGAFNWTPTKPGKYQMVVHVKDTYSSRGYDEAATKEISVSEVKASINSFTIDSNMLVNNSYVIETTGTSPNKILYRYWLGDMTTGEWKIVRDYNENGTFNWTPTKVGKYIVEVHAKDINSTRGYDQAVSQVINVVKDPKASIDSFTADAYMFSNKAYTLETKGNSLNTVLYRYWLGDMSTGEWTIIRDYNENGIFNWTPTKAGKYIIEVHVKDINSTSGYDQALSREINVINEGKASISEFDAASSIINNVATSLKTIATAPNKALYRYWLGDMTTGQWRIIRDYNENGEFTWTPDKIGTYQIVVHVKDQYSNTGYDDERTKQVIVQGIKTSITSFNVGSSFTINKTSTITTTAVSANKTLYRYWLWDKGTGQWNIIRDYNESGVLNWTPTKPGSYQIVVHVKDSDSSNGYDDARSVDFTVEGTKTSIVSFNVGTDFTVNRTSTIVTSAVSTNKVLYRYWLGDMATGEWKIIRDYNENGTLNWIPAKPGNYQIVVHVKDVNSSNGYDDARGANVVAYSKIIVLDAGHGGYDPGAVSGSTLEKDLNMQVTQKLGNILTTLGYNVLYTRQPSNDTFVDLDERTAFANSSNADLFLSIHHNSLNSTSTGFSSHYSSYRPEIETQDVYVVYNGIRYPFIKEVSGNIYFNDNGVERYASINNCTVYDPTPSDAAIKSGLLADKLVETVTSLGLNKDGADPSKDHNLYVTRHTTMPSVLLELGYISNPTELAKISQPSFQDLIAQKIAEAIKAFF